MTFNCSKRSRLGHGERILFSHTKSEERQPPAAQDSPTTRPDMLFAIIGTSFGLAYLPVAPGTWGTLPGVAIFLFITLLVSPQYHTGLIAAALAAFCALTVALGPWAERYWKTKDPRVYVPDEVTGFLLTVFLFRTPDPFLTAGWAFVITRVMDILKFPPARQLERLPGGWGILVDDLISSVYAAALLYALTRFLPLQWFGGNPIVLFGW